ncbi:MAG TPA: choice-of-anchor D domain-containing protein, partial [Rubricoccaceae bacterium]|nr:choice-of-anchor D domain-containing protein [Rubricoccaceae bacterium]
MFRYTLTFVLAALAAAGARAQTYVDVIDPAGNPALWGLEWRAGALYATDTNPDRLVQVDLTTGAVTQEFTLSFDPRGLAWDGTNWRISTGFDTSSPLIYTLSPTGTNLGSIPAPSALTHDLQLHDGRLFAAKAYPDNEASVVGVDPATGAVLETIPFPSTQPGGIAFLDTNTFWVTNVGDDSGSSGVYVLWKMNRAGAVLDTLAMPDGYSRPRGLAYDGTRYLYVVLREDVTPFEWHIAKVDLQSAGNPELSYSPSAFDFGPRVFGASYNAPLILSNVGDGPLVISNVQVTGDAVFTTDLTAQTIAPGATINATVTFAPTAAGPYSATLTFETNDVSAPVVTIPLAGIGLHAQRHLTLLDPSHDYGPVRIEPPGDALSVVRWPTRLVNEGATTLTVTGITFSDPAFTADETTFPLTLAPLDTAVVRIAFRPTQVRAYSATATVASDDPESPTRTITLAGQGVNPVLEGGDVVWHYDVPLNPQTSSTDRKVFSLTPMDDITGDDRPDLVLAARNYQTIALDANGWGTPDTLWTFRTCPNNNDCGAVSGNAQLFEYGLATGVDLNGDGTGDVVIGTEGGNDGVYALDGRNGNVLWETNDESDPYLASYYSVSVGDVDGAYDVN